MADKLGITRKHLCTVFHRVFGVAPRQYITEKRQRNTGERKAFTAALLGELEEENDWGLPVTPEGKMEERKRKCAADVYSVVK